MIEMIISQSSSESSTILDCFAGGGTTLKCAEKLGRKWIGIDESLISIITIQKTIQSNYVLYDFSDQAEKENYLQRTGDTCDKKGNKKGQQSIDGSFWSKP